jgi:hypothetical protein
MAGFDVVYTPMCVLLCTDCRMCKKHKRLEVTHEEYKQYDKGAMIQDAFPTMDAGDRELLISGICGPCFDSMFPPEPTDG